MLLHIWKADTFYIKNPIDAPLLPLENQDGVQDCCQKSWYYAVKVQLYKLFGVLKVAI